MRARLASYYEAYGSGSPAASQASTDIDNDDFDAEEYIRVLRKTASLGELKQRRDAMLSECNALMTSLHDENHEDFDGERYHRFVHEDHGV